MRQFTETQAEKRKHAIDKLGAIDAAAPPEAIRAAALACFEAGAPLTAKRLLNRVGKQPEIADQPWHLRFRSWLDAREARRRLADRGPILPSEADKIAALAENLIAASRFDLARRLLARLLAEPENLLAPPGYAIDEQRLLNYLVDQPAQRNRLMQRLALSTYKDADLHPSRALPEAERLLRLVGLDRPDCSDPETLGLGGAVCKRRWELTGQAVHLRQALAYYLRGWEATDGEDRRRDRDAYCGGNAAYVMDLLAHRQETGEGAEPAAGDDAAHQLRMRIARELWSRLMPSRHRPSAADGKAWLSLADAWFGLGRYGPARRCYMIASRFMKSDWERRSAFVQAHALARLRGIPLPPPAADEQEWHPAWQALWPLLRERTAAALAGIRPKTGLALSGGGFRAAFYHLGMLARLAEADALRHVEVISTVSGGSIVGTLYFLKLKQLLESKPDEEIAGADYCRLVNELIEEFRAGVEKNLRMRAFASPRAIGRMAGNLYYNRTRRIGELYEKYFYRRPLGDKNQPVLRDLIVVPKGEQGDFSPSSDNWLRRAKVPILLINATNLNSGHSWQFAGSFMGEPPGLLRAGIDTNERYGRIHFDDPRCLAAQDFPLGTAVAASSAVPGLFNPVRLPGLYEKRDVQLADGGVYDNQGVDTLQQERCDIILCSDASGQLDDQRSPSTLLLGVLKRANNIAMERVRIVEYQDMQARLESGALDGLLFVHLRLGLAVGRVRPRCETAAQTGEAAVPPQTDYGIDAAIQRQLSCIRTDLDSFTEIEADALMFSAYRATGRQIDLQRDTEGAWPDFGTVRQACGGIRWPFERMAPYLCRAADASHDATAARLADIGRQLDVSRKLFAKPLYLILGSWGATLFLIVAAVVLAASCVGLACLARSVLGDAAILGMAGFVAFLAITALAANICRFGWKPALQWAGELSLAILLLPVTFIGLWPDNGIFLRRGAYKRLQCIE